MQRLVPMELKIKVDQYRNMFDGFGETEIIRTRPRLNHTLGTVVEEDGNLV